ncbi:TPA: integrase domain-containing protein, partial [Klebsiella pneumoniae]
RAEETVQSAKSLKTWRKSLEAGNDNVRVVFGSKGGRPRDATVFEKAKVGKLLNEAIQYIEKNNGKLIDKPTLHQALDRYHNVLRESGMTGIHAPHSLRYAYSQDAVNHHLENGMSRKEAEALVSMDLGHGDGRGAYVARVYNRTDEPDE